jgi:hypothetical protein
MQPWVKLMGCAPKQLLQPPGLQPSGWAVQLQLNICKNQKRSRTKRAVLFFAVQTATGGSNAQFHDFYWQKFQKIPSQKRNPNGHARVSSRFVTSTPTVRGNWQTNPR